VDIRVATFRITSRCTHSCEYCFAPKHVPEMDFLKLRQVFDIFVKAGVQNVLLTGGEPSLRDDFAKIVEELKSRGLGIFLDTCGDLFFKYADAISQSVSILGLPIDWVGGGYRGADNFERVLEILTYYKRKEQRPGIRIGTVVTRDNLASLVEIGELISYFPVFAWKLYQFTPQEVSAIKNRRLLEVSEEIFGEATKNVKARFSPRLEVIISKRADRNLAYLFIESDGRVVVPVDNMDICRLETVGSIFDEDIFQRWMAQVNLRNYMRNLEPTFNIK